MLRLFNDSQPLLHISQAVHRSNDSKAGASLSSPSFPPTDSCPATMTSLLAPSAGELCSPNPLGMCGKAEAQDLLVGPTQNRRRFTPTAHSGHFGASAASLPSSTSEISRVIWEAISMCASGRVEVLKSKARLAQMKTNIQI